MTSPSPSAPTGICSVCGTSDRYDERGFLSGEHRCAGTWLRSSPPPQPPFPGTGDDQRVNIARIVADHWRNAAMAHADDDMIPFRVMAHPLCMVLSALDGETDPNQLGVSEGPDADKITALAQRPVSEGGEPHG